MSTASKPELPKVSLGDNDGTDEFKAKVFVKSSWPKTWKENIKLFFNLFVNFLS